jgi:replicative DNA helicase
MPNQLLQGAIEENTLTLLCWSDLYAPDLTLRLSPELFSTRAYKDIAEAAFAHIERYGKAPALHLWDLLEVKLRRGDEGKLLRSTLEQMKELNETLQPQFVLDSLDHFISKRRLIMALEAATDAAHGDDLGAAQAALQTYEPLSGDAEDGLWLHDGEAMAAELDVLEEDFFSSGVEELDRRGCRPARGTLTTLVAPAKRGKSWWCNAVARAGLQHRKKVLHISLENSRRVVAKRYIQTFLAMSTEEISDNRITTFLRDAGSDRIKDMVPVTLPAPEIANAANKRYVANKLSQFSARAKLHIKAFPSGTLTIATLNGYLDKLDRKYNFRPDLIILDYPDLMAVDRKNMRLDLGRIFVELRGVASQRNCAICAPTQGSRESSTAKVVGANQVAEDWSKIMTADTILTYSQTASEKKVGLARLLVAAAREAKDGYLVLITQNYKTGQFCLDSTYLSDYMEETAERFIKAEKDGD